MFKFFIENELISSNQSGFKPGDPCINQLVSIKQEICKSFDEGHEVRGVFLDISKAFDKAWYDGIIFKLTQNGISGNLLKLLRDFLSERSQCIVFNGPASTGTNVTAGVGQGSILGPLFFISPKNFLGMLSYLQTIHIYFLLFMTARLLQMFLTRT